MPVRTGGRAVRKDALKWEAVAHTLPQLLQAQSGEVRAEKVQMADAWWWRVRVGTHRATWQRGLEGLEAAWHAALEGQK